MTSLALTARMISSTNPTDEIARAWTDPMRPIARVPLVTPHNPKLRGLLLKPEPLTAEEWAYVSQCELAGDPDQSNISQENEHGE